MVLSALLSSVIAGIGWGLAFWGRRQTKHLCRWAYRSHVVFMSLAALRLLLLIINHRFEYAYVSSHTSTSLSPLYLVSSFWAGHEGSFLLWGLIGAWIGLVLLRVARPLELFFYNLTQLGLTSLLLISNPFALLEIMPTEGLGLNPLLQDPWMAIHPPVIFLGYVGLAIPFALSLAALLERKESEWAQRTLPWSLFGWLCLGSGIIIGALWAYEVQGWGGYWSWDPVENAALIPWLMATALLHGQLQAPGILKTNFVLAISTYLIILLATFVTRSGLFADFSVHSFADLGLGGLLLTMVALLGVLASIILGSRWKGLRGQRASFLSVATIAVLLCAAFIVGAGTVTPLITAKLGRPASLEASFYNKGTFPLALVAGLLMALFPWIERKQSFIIPGIFVLAGTIPIAVLTRQPLQSLFTGVFLVSLLTNAIAWVASRWRSGYLIHGGIAIIFLGIIVSANFTTTERLALRPGESGEVVGHQIRYLGETPTGLEMDLTGQGGSFKAFPKIYSQDGEVVRKPHIDRGLFNDIYISPLALQQDWGPGLRLGKGETVVQDGYEVTFLGFDLMGHQGGRVGTQVTISGAGAEHQVVPTLTIKPSGREQEIAYISDLGLAVALDEVDAGGEVVLRLFQPDAAPQVLILEVSQRPLISFLWLGALLAIVGSIMTLLQRKGYSQGQEH
ncbi:MAG: cytochrome c biogenesis protein CcsA [Firmicutes bacterium]|nr:cytochrome c biogenesis protein CcsA [Bacillota bacterium]